jgi:AcrR family transcriptional regulator
MSKVRERILDTASGLFYQSGIQAVGVDSIILGADVARMSFYRHFKSKEGLVLAFLERRDQEFRSWLDAEVRRLAPDPADRPLAVFDALALRFDPESYRGCAFINAIAETADRQGVVHRAAASYKLRIQDYLARLLEEAGASAKLAPEWLLLMDGAVVTAVREGSVEPAFRAKRLAALLLAAGKPAAAKRPAKASRRRSPAPG